MDENEFKKREETEDTIKLIKLEVNQTNTIYKYALIKSYKFKERNNCNFEFCYPWIHPSKQACHKTTSRYSRKYKTFSSSTL